MYCVCRYLAMSEPADFVHVFDVQQDFALSQEIDLFGEMRASLSVRTQRHCLWASPTAPPAASWSTIGRARGLTWSTTESRQTVLSVGIAD